MPLGYAAKIYVEIGDVDRNNSAATKPGSYYKWIRGIHMLCRLEGEAKYRHRPSYEDTKELQG